MNAKYEKTLTRVFRKPTLNDIKWRDVERMLRSLGATIEERAGSRVVVKLNNEVQVFHRPHPRPEMKKGAVEAMRRFLENAGIK